LAGIESIRGATAEFRQYSAASADPSPIPCACEPVLLAAKSLDSFLNHPSSAQIEQNIPSQELLPVILSHVSFRGDDLAGLDPIVFMQ
jgi:hypothetical protein